MTIIHLIQNVSLGNKMFLKVNLENIFVEIIRI